jgi:PST family polysaccharide transporter/teichuronic acid exporter/lipopolysaccharide exporter
MAVSLTRQATSAAKWMTVASIFTALVSVVQVSVLARYLEPADFGAVALLMVILEICNVFIRTGFSDALVVNTGATRRQLSTLYWVNVALGVAIYGLFFLSAPFLDRGFVTVDLAEMARVMGLMLLIGAFVVQFDAMMRRELLLRQLALFRIGSHVVGLVVAVYLAVEGYGAWALVFAHLGMQISMNLCLWVVAIGRHWLPGGWGSIREISELLRFGAYRVGASLLGALNSRVDQLAVGAFLGPAALGYYNLAFNLAMQPFQRINPILTQVSFPIFAKVKDDNDKLLKGYRKGLRLLVSINAPLLLGLAVTAPLVVPALLGPRWGPVVPIVQILAVGVLFRSAANINIGLILAKGKYQWPFYWNLVLLTIVPVAIVLVSQITQSLVMVSLALTGINLCLFVFGYLLFPRRLLGRFDLPFLSDFGRPVLAACLMLPIVALAIDNVAVDSLWLQIGMMAALGGTIYAAASLLIQRQHTGEILEFLRSRA